VCDGGSRAVLFDCWDGLGIDQTCSCVRGEAGGGQKFLWPARQPALRYYE
jgi:hypothetical protein